MTLAADRRCQQVMTMVDDSARRAGASATPMPFGSKAAERVRGRPTRLTSRLAADIVACVASGSPVAWAAQAHGVGRSTMALWASTARAARSKKPDERSAYERRTMQLMDGIAQAEAQWGNRLVRAIADAAGVTDQRPTRRITTERTGPDGVTERTERTETLAADWRAAAHLGRLQFPNEMGDRSAVEVTGPSGGAISVQPGEVWAELERLRRQHLGHKARGEEHAEGCLVCLNLRRVEESKG